MKHMHEEHKENMRRAHARPEVKQMHINAMIGNKIALGKHPSREVNEKRRIKLLGENNGMYGKHHSEETKAKISKTKKSRSRLYHEQFVNSNIF